MKQRMSLAPVIRTLVRRHHLVAQSPQLRASEPSRSRVALLRQVRRPGPVLPSCVEFRINVDHLLHIVGIKITLISSPPPSKLGLNLDESCGKLIN
jgi:hypothetical protein